MNLNESNIKWVNLSNRDIIKFYSAIDSRANFHYTLSYEKEHRQPNDGYIKTANVFMENEKKCDKKEKAFLDWLQNKNENGTLYDLKSLSFVKDDKDFDVFLEKRMICQKWHCIVSWYARLEYEGRLSEKEFSESIHNKDAWASCIFKKSIKCPELRLWLVEAAKDNLKITDADVLNFYKEALKYSANKKENITNWNNIWDEYLPKIGEAIYGTLM